MGGPQALGAVGASGLAQKRARTDPPGLLLLGAFVHGVPAVLAMQGFWKGARRLAAVGGAPAMRGWGSDSGLLRSDARGRPQIGLEAGQ